MVCGFFRNRIVDSYRKKIKILTCPFVWTLVEAGHRAVIFDRLSGVKNTVIPEGTHFVVPFLQYPIIYDVRTRPRTISTTTGTKDLQVVSLTLRVLSKPDENQLPSIYKRLGLDYDDRVLPSIGNEVLKATVAQFNADQLLTLRDQVCLLPWYSNSFIEANSLRWILGVSRYLRDSHSTCQGV